MESDNQAYKVIVMANKVITTLIGKQYVLSDSGYGLMRVKVGLAAMKKALWPYSDVADERIVDYLVYHLYLLREPRWGIDADTLFYDRSFEKYRKQFMTKDGKSGINWYINLWLQGGGLSREKLVAMIKPPKPSRAAGLVYMESEEPLKRRFKNTEAGYMLCQRSTTGWSPRSASCSDCVYSERCENVTEARFPELVRLRKIDYDNGKKK